MSTRKRLELLATASFTDAQCPTADQIAAFALDRNYLTDTEQREITAHLQACSVCAEDLMALRAPSGIADKVLTEPIPLQPVLGYRSFDESLHVRQYRAAQLHVDLTVGPLEGDYRRLSGQVLRDEQGVPFASVMIRQIRKRSLHKLTNETGFFTFDLVPIGNHRLLIRDGQVELHIDDLALEGDE